MTRNNSDFGYEMHGRFPHFTAEKNETVENKST